MQRVTIPALLRTPLSVLPLVPACWLLAEAALGLGGPDTGKALVHGFGLWSLNLLLLTLTITPLQRFTPINWMPLRRMLGLYALAYALLHVMAYMLFYLGLDAGLLARELTKRPYILLGATAFLMLAALGITSSRRWQRRLGKHWKPLHRLIYPATLLAIIHFAWQVKSGLGNAPWYALLFAVLLLARRKS